MSNEKKSELDDEPLRGFNLNLAYSLLALAIIAAICIALFIVLPFYHQHS